MKDYRVFYQKLTAPLRRRPSLLKVLTYFNQLMTLLMPLVYAGVLFNAYLVGNWRGLLLYLLLPATGFIVLSLVRQRINQPRPYESWDFSPLPEFGVRNYMPGAVEEDTEQRANETAGNGGK